MFPPIEQALEAANYEKTEIDDIVIVGGSCRIPMIGQQLQAYFGKPVNLQLKPDEAICMGASIYAGLIQRDPTLQGVSFRDITPMNLGTDAGINEEGKELVSTII